jgi:membrane carboxypeptidase/penicillin-binding protein
MPFRIIGKALLALVVCTLAYILVAAMWAWLSFDDTLSRAPMTALNLSARQTEILLKVEDPTFYQHRGLSLADGQGVATISSAVAGQLFLSERKLPGMRGAMQTWYRGVFACCKRIDLGRDVMALVLDAKLSKDRQLALYVSHVYMGTDRGEQVTGLPHAAQHYVGKPLDHTTEQEFIALVAMIKAPNLYHPERNRAAHRLRTARLQAMLSGQCQPAGWFDTTYSRCTFPRR